MRMSAVVPCYNAEAFIADCLDSIRDQSQATSEIVVVDDGSTDGSVGRVAEWRRRNPATPVRVISQDNQGVSAARNTGWRAASGDWVAFLDADDLWLPRHNETLLQAARAHDGCALVFADAERLDLPDGRLPSHFELADITGLLTGQPVERCPRGGALHDRLLSGSYVPTSAVMVAKSALAAADGFDTTLRYGEDRELWLRLFQQGEVVVCRAAIGRHRYHASNATHDRNRLAELSDKVRLYNLLLTAPERYGLSPEQLGIVKSARARELTRLRRQAARFGLARLRQYRALLAREGMRVRAQDWLRGAVMTLGHRAHLSERGRRP